ncbi:MAG: hypothetical protein GC156_00510 [Actinomycetales bacterium]|nr:hypothetical protein [Actinomycetales bacterium]
MRTAYRPWPTADASAPTIDRVSCHGRRPLGTWMTVWSHIYTEDPSVIDDRDVCREVRPLPRRPVGD